MGEANVAERTAGKHKRRGLGEGGTRKGKLNRKSNKKGGTSRVAPFKKGLLWETPEPYRGRCQKRRNRRGMVMREGTPARRRGGTQRKRNRRLNTGWKAENENPEERSFGKNKEKKGT